MLQVYKLRLKFVKESCMVYNAWGYTCDWIKAKV